jgi:hypothetical protein
VALGGGGGSPWEGWLLTDGNGRSRRKGQLWWSAVVRRQSIVGGGQEDGE